MILERRNYRVKFFGGYGVVYSVYREKLGLEELDVERMRLECSVEVWEWGVFLIWCVRI